MSGGVRTGWTRAAWGIVALLAGTADARATGDDFEAAVACYEARNYSQARQMFARQREARPDDADLDFYLGRLALWFDDGPAALAHLERAVQRRPREARLHNALGDAYGLAAQQAGLLAKLGWARKCLAAYERAVELAPGNAAFRWSLLGYHCVAPAIAGGSRSKAFAQAAAIGRIEGIAGRMAHATLYLAEKNHAAAFAQFDSVPAEAAQNFLVLYQIGRCAAVSGEQLERGRAALRACLQLPEPQGDGLPSHASAHYRLANILEKQGELVAARAEHDAALRLQPDFRPDKIALKN